MIWRENHQKKKKQTNVTSKFNCLLCQHFLSTWENVDQTNTYIFWLNEKAHMLPFIFFIFAIIVFCFVQIPATLKFSSNFWLVSTWERFAWKYSEDNKINTFFLRITLHVMLFYSFIFRACSLWELLALPIIQKSFN